MIEATMTDMLELPQRSEKPATSTDVRASIQDHFGAGGERYAVLFEVRNGTAWAANRSVDAVVMSLWPSLGLELWGMEIKISRSDWLREVREPKKASEVFDHFDRWFLVAPPGVAKPDEVPAPWGWYEPRPDSRGLVQVRAAAKNENVRPVDRSFLAALMRRIAKTDDNFVSAAVDKALREQSERHRREVDQTALRRMGDLRSDAEQWAKLRGMLTDKLDDYIYSDDVVGALQLLLKAGIAKSYGGLHSLLAEVERMRESLLRIADDLKIEPGEKRRKRGAR